MLRVGQRFLNAAESTAGAKTTRVENSDPNFFTRNLGAEAFKKAPKQRQSVILTLRVFKHTSNIAFALIFAGVVAGPVFVQYFYAGDFGERLAEANRSKRRSYWARRNETVDSTLHQHSSLHDMMGLKQYSVTTEADDALVKEKEERDKAIASMLLEKAEAAKKARTA